MSVSINTYVIFGIKLDNSDCEKYEVDMWDEKFEDYMMGDPNLGYEIISDGMCGEYIVFGKVLATMSEGSEIDFVELDIPNLDWSDLCLKFKKIFGFDIPKNPTTFIFNHYS